MPRRQSLWQRAKMEQAALGKLAAVQEEGEEQQRKSSPFSLISGADAGLAVVAEIPHMSKSLEESEERRALKFASGKQLLEEQIKSLESYQADVLDRWHSPSDFGRVDLVCADLLKKGSILEAVKYMERVRGLMDLIVTKLKSKVQVVDPNTGDVVGGMKSTVPLAKTQAPKVQWADKEKEQQEQRRTFKPRRPSALNLKKKAKPGVLQEDLGKVRELQAANRELKDKMAKVEKRLADTKTRVEERDRALEITRERLNGRTMEAQSQTSRLQLLEKQKLDLKDKVDGLTALLKSTEEDFKRASKQAASMRSKLMQHDNQNKVGDLKSRGKDQEIEELQGKLKSQNFKLKGVEKLLAESKGHHAKKVEGLQARVKELEGALAERDKKVQYLQSTVASSGKAKKKGKKGPYETTLPGL